MRSPETVSEARLESWRSEEGHRAEEKVFAVLTKGAGWEPVEIRNRSLEEIAASFTGERIGIARAPGRWDWERGIDHVIFIERTAVPVDQSISRDADVHAQKLDREKRGGPAFVPLENRTVNLAYRGSVRDIEEVRDLMLAGVRGYLERRRV